MTKSEKIMLWIAFLLLGVGGSWYWWETRPVVPPFTTEAVQRGDVSETVSVVGRLEPPTYADMSFAMVGTVESIAVEQGATVQTGQTIAVLDTSVLESELDRANVALAIAIENERLAHRHWDLLKPEERSVKKLATQQARQDIQTLRVQKDQSLLASPLDGTLSELDLRVGETVTTGRVIGRVSGPGDFLLKADIPESDIARIVVGQSASVTFDTLSADDMFTARVLSVDPTSTVIQDVIYYTVTLALPDQDTRLKEGMSANIDILVSERKQVLVVPYRALVRDGSSAFVEIPTSDMMLERRPVLVGIESDDGSIEIVLGVKEGEQVVVGKAKE